MFTFFGLHFFLQVAGKKADEARKKVTLDHPRVPAEVPRRHFWQIEIGISVDENAF